MPSTRSSSPKPADLLYDEGGNACWWLASAWTKEEICDPDGEWDYLELTPDKLHEQWHVCRWTTPEELANEDWVYDQFGDVEMNPVDTSVVYWHCKPDTPGAVLYWTTEG